MRLGKSLTPPSAVLSGIIHSDLHVDGSKSKVSVQI